MSSTHNRCLLLAAVIIALSNILIGQQGMGAKDILCNEVSVRRKVRVGVVSGEEERYLENRERLSFEVTTVI